MSTSSPASLSPGEWSPGEWELMSLDLGRFCASLRGRSEEDLASTVEVVLEGMDTGSEATHELSSLLPSLERLRLRSSTLRSVRDLGSLQLLRVLNAPRCGLADLDGVASLFLLEELYLAFNDLRDCTALAFHESLEVLDLESNQLADDSGIEPLGTCPKLNSLTLLGNPLSDREDYKALVRKTVGHLETLDDEPFSRSRDSEEEVLNKEDIYFPSSSAARALRLESSVVSEAVKHFRPTTPGFFREEDRPRTAPAEEERAAFSCWEEMLHLRGRPTSPTQEAAPSLFVKKSSSSSSVMTHGDNNDVFSGSIARGMRSRNRRRAAAAAAAEAADPPQKPCSLEAQKLAFSKSTPQLQDFSRLPRSSHAAKLDSVDLTLGRLRLSKPRKTPNATGGSTRRRPPACDLAPY